MYVQDRLAENAKRSEESSPFSCHLYLRASDHSLVAYALKVSITTFLLRNTSGKAERRLPHGKARAQMDEKQKYFAVQSVHLVLYKEPRGDEALSTVPMEENESGVWSVTGPRADWEGLYFHYEVTVFCPWTNRIETSLSTDPYSRR